MKKFARISVFWFGSQVVLVPYGGLLMNHIEPHIKFHDSHVAAVTRRQLLPPPARSLRRSIHLPVLYLPFITGFGACVCFNGFREFVYMTMYALMAYARGCINETYSLTFQVCS
ncbi:hypothetical protein L1987_23152 [Smallanthus sonchifolius]|uniref:Uncharacterized protein n=1 Tax=Smallanthus sonchifolius TaxID=185202 RepID=A0ACB9IHD7_9ASTR|nr:hypothetical protein L1987_23152 [Smallanthus sonchifolius]